jgi:monofunctional glycosyltransferase
MADRARKGCIRGCLGPVIGLGVRGVLVVLLLAGLYTGYRWLTWPDVAALAEQNPETTAFIERARKRAAKEDAQVAWTWVPYGRISPHLKRAVLVSEDINFHSHDGFERGEMETALRDAWEQRKLPRGASTLTQQVAKNLYLSSSRNPLRKIEEAILTRQLEGHLSKRRIFEIYLNVAQMGPRVFGAEAAARHWYGGSAAGLSEGQAAELAACLPNPREWHPGSGSRNYQGRISTVRRRMNKAGWLWKVI